MSSDLDGFFCLHSQKTSLILEQVDRGIPIWRYWGPKLPDNVTPPSPQNAQRSVPPYSLDTNVPLTIFPTFGTGWFGPSALLAHRNGKDFAQAFETTNIDWIKPNQAVQIALIDFAAQIKVEIFLNLDAASNTLSCNTKLTNLGPDNLDVNWLAAAALPIPANAKTVQYITGKYGQEFTAREDHLSDATWLRENWRGVTSHDCPPLGIVKAGGANQHYGHAFGAQLAWSGNHVQRIDAIEDGSFLWLWGEMLAPGEVRLRSGEPLESPTVLANFSENGLDGVAQNFHTALRARMSWPLGQPKPRPVHFNTWEGVYFDLKEVALFEMADKAAALGVERFILDDGWFQGRRSDQSGLGDWWVDLDVFPNGLLPLAKHVTSLGMEFGLWVEPEMVNPDSHLFREHPDWALQLKGRPDLTARNQLVLDLSNPQVFDYLLEKIGSLLDGLPISYLKWDHNRNLTLAGLSQGTAAYRQQVLSAYRLFDAIRKQWPNVEIEACAGGGGRIDAGILQHTHRVWTSDCIDATSRVAIQSGFLQYFPPEIMGSHIGASPAHTTGRKQGMDFRAGVAMAGHFGIELDPRMLSQRHVDQVTAWIQTYKSLRNTIHFGQVWQGKLDNGLSWLAQGTADDCVVSVYRTKPMEEHFPKPIILPFLDQNAVYSQTIVMPAHTVKANWPSHFLDQFTMPLQVSGAWLANAGLITPALHGEGVFIVRLKKQG